MQKKRLGMGKNGSKKEKDKRYRIKLSKYTKGGLVSSAMFVCGLAVLLVSFLISFLAGGEAGIWIGLFPLAAFALAVGGFVIAIKSFKEEQDGKFLFFSYFGMISNAVVWLLVAGAYLAFI